MSRIIPGLLLLIAVTALPQAALAADAANGEKLAKRWCAACHVVASDQKSGNTQVAPFCHRQGAGFRYRQARALPATAASEDAGHEPHAQRGRRPHGLYREPGPLVLHRRLSRGIDRHVSLS